ncbi:MULTISPECIES: hypothetical protein [unclassified Chelatococcus]|jgi:hypothetical protein|uniref:hypothetical protein n=1 Tax=unclassified Chelatococcus TaxID=2638111 RepID=UPI0020BDA027|nr:MULTISPECIES: hypothetical protein [unclassified Chelatococcus]MCO5076948.1 hypothetical protein [Chelatococcus sp.]CAH1671897.1 conserved hypothetical protein [Hyphomicrobiales bacterium]CAH1675879.1 conserved hypothetical protein [Hyphomicrobiales bacterium]
MPTPINRRVVAGAVLAGVITATLNPALSAEQGAKLFTFVSEKDEIVAALTKEDASLGDDATAIGKALRERGTITVWRYAVRKAKDGELEQAPFAKISVQAQGNLRVEPYRTPLRVVPVE